MPKARSEPQANGVSEGVPVLRPWSEDVWIAEAPLRFYGVPFGTRMTVLRMPDGGLVLHSPIDPTPALRAEVERLGPVRHLVAPNKLHHLFVGAAKATWPEARLWAPPGLAARRADLAFDAALEDAEPADFGNMLEPLVVRGSRVMQEVVFLHPASRTLLVADLCEHFGPWSPWLTRCVARVARMYGRPCMPPDWRASFRDRGAARQSFERLLGWGFDRAILAHGRLLEAGARQALADSFRWALR